MNFGMLWFDNDKKTTVIDKADRAAAYFKNKYGFDATLCFVHPSMLEDKDKAIKTEGGLKLQGIQTVLPQHFWIGCDDKDESEYAKVKLLSVEGDE